MQSYNNEMLSALSLKDRIAIEPMIVEVELPAGQVLVKYNTPIDHVHFMESGLASVVAASPDGHVVETLLVGFEGYVGIPIVLGCDRTAAKVFMQVQGRAWRIASHKLRETMAHSAAWRLKLLGYVHAAMTQISYTALSNSAHRVEQRLARWLSMSHDQSPLPGSAIFRC